MKVSKRVVRAVEASARYGQADDAFRRAQDERHDAEIALRETWRALTVAEQEALTAIYHPGMVSS